MYLYDTVIPGQTVEIIEDKNSIFFGFVLYQTETFEILHFGSKKRVAVNWTISANRNMSCVVSLLLHILYVF